MAETGEQNSLISNNPDHKIVTKSPPKVDNIEIKIINMKKRESTEHQRSHASSEWGPGFEDLPPA